MILFDRTDDRIVLAESLLTESLAIEFLLILPTESAGYPAGRRATPKTHKNNIVGRKCQWFVRDGGGISTNWSNCRKWKMLLDNRSWGSTM